MAGHRDIAGEESTEHFFTSFTDLLVGVIFLFLLMLMVFALNFKTAETASKVTAESLIITEEVRATLLRVIAAEMEKRGTTVELDFANGIVRLPESLLFASGQWELSEKGKQVLADLAAVLMKYVPCSSGQVTGKACDNLGLQMQTAALLDSILIEGHTDKEPFSNKQGMTNWELSAFRAISVYKALTGAEPPLDNAVVNSKGQPVMGVSAYADRRPVSENDTPNRRIDFRFNMRTPRYENQNNLPIRSYGLPAAAAPAAPPAAYAPSAGGAPHVAR